MNTFTKVVVAGFLSSLLVGCGFGMPDFPTEPGLYISSSNGKLFVRMVKPTGEIVDDKGYGGTIYSPNAKLDDCGIVSLRSMDERLVEVVVLQPSNKCQLPGTAFYSLVR
ncbi:MAG: hypothetical protein JKY71_01540 [Alphaproteobacteria bacterium]|nr:hypothetical protein [Alphaproteobacteria bacterium]